MEQLLLYLSEILFSTLFFFILVVGILVSWKQLTAHKRQRKIQAKLDKQRASDASFHENLIRIAKTQTPTPLNDDRPGRKRG